MSRIFENYDPPALDELFNFRLKHPVLAAKTQLYVENFKPILRQEEVLLPFLDGERNIYEEINLQPLVELGIHAMDGLGAYVKAISNGCTEVIDESKHWLGEIGPYVVSTSGVIISVKPCRASLVPMFSHRVEAD